MNKIWYSIFFEHRGRTAVTAFLNKYGLKPDEVQITMKNDHSSSINDHSSSIFVVFYLSDHELYFNELDK